MVKDLVCGRMIDHRTTNEKRHYKGHFYYFCSHRCYIKFREHPRRYVARAERAVAARRQRGYGSAPDLESDEDVVMEANCG
ncbi:MAG: YHS domain-containing protein [Anaerolineae bacterium]|jgi:YHS domain-containing protein